MEVVTEKPTTKVVPEGYKRTEVGVIPEDWEVCKQKEVVEYINGRAYSKDEWENSGVPVVRLQNLTGSGDKYYYSTLNLPQKNYMHNGDLIFMWSASFGPYIWSGPKAIFHYHIWKINCDKDLVDKVFYYFKLLELTEALKQNTSGSTMLHLTKTSMEEYKIALPETLEEQQVIAESLSDVDALIAELDALIEKKQQIKKGAMQQLLSGKKRLPGFDGEWEEKTLGKLCTSISDGTHYTPNYVDHGVPFYSVENVTGENFTDVKYISKQEHKKLIRRCKPEKGDILLTRIGTLGKTKLIDWDIEASIYVSLALLKLSDRINEQYFYRYTESDKFVEEVKKRALTNASPQKINMGELENVPVYYPKETKEQKAIAGILSDMDAEIQTLQSKRAKYEQIKQGMMQELLTGKTRLV